jgi:hypothetical protein
VRRIESVLLGCLFILASQSAPAAQTEGDTRLNQALVRLAAEASNFWHSAPGFIARETLTQKAIVPSKRKLRIGAAAVEPYKPEFKDREIVSWYGLAGYRKAPEAMREFRRVISVDGKALGDAATARAQLRAAIQSADDRTKRSLEEQFEKIGLSGSALDFGQLLLLFTRANIPKYSFLIADTGLIGAEHALVLQFRQRAGKESVHISEGRKNTRAPLEGELWVREDDYRPLRITLTVVRRESHDAEVQDDARVDYAPAAGANLPVSVVYRRFVNGQLTAESSAQYSGWNPADAP